MKTEPTFIVKLYIGLKEGYDGWVHEPREAAHECQKYCDKVGLGVTINETTFIYTDGNEPGVIIGLINYPRFPKSPEELKSHIINIAKKLMKQFQQERCSIVCTDETILLEQEDLDD